MLTKRQFYIDGTWVDPIQGTDCESVYPSSEEPEADIDVGAVWLKAGIEEFLEVKSVAAGRTVPNRRRKERSYCC